MSKKCTQLWREARFQVKTVQQQQQQQQQQLLLLLLQLQLQQLRNYNYNYATLHYSTQDYTTLRYPTLHYARPITPLQYDCNYTTLITLHHNYNSTTLQLRLQLQYTTLHPAVVGEVTTATIATTPTNTTPTTVRPFGQSVDSLCHP